VSLHVVGVRHHSPVCAQLVRDTIARVRPKVVLIEGPADMNARLGELALDHTPPVALFSFHFSEQQRHSSYCPFCSHSPEWVALRDGLAMGAEVRFMDLPGWAMELHGIENRYGDHALAEGFDEALQAALGVSGYDAFWDTAFEQPEPTDLAERLHTYFDEVRHVRPATAEDLGRERFMRRYVRWALAQGGDVVVVCGGFHEPVLLTATELEPDEVDDGLEPLPPEPPDDSRSATWLIPFDEKRLDSFRGYASGLPSPAWYRWVWEEGREAAPRNGLRATALGLRDRGQTVSVADTVAAWTQATALARMRGHASVGRIDLLDAIASTWVKDALDGPLPWTARSVLARGTHPVLVELVSALCGDRRGTLDPTTPLPPLVHHVRAEWERLGLTPTYTRQEHVLRRGEPKHLERRLTLERLLLLRVDGFARVAGTPAETTYGILRTPETDPSLLEAASYGPTLEAAALAVLEELSAQAETFPQLVHLLEAGIEAGLPQISDRAQAQMTAAIDREPDLEVMGQGLGRLVGWMRHGGLEQDQLDVLTPVAETAVDRTLWLLEGMHGDVPVSLGRVQAVVALRDAALQNLGARVHLAGVLERVSGDVEAPADVRGASLGALASLGELELDATAALAEESLSRVSEERLGDYLAGLLRTAREVLTEGEGLLAGVDEALCTLGPASFLTALPSLRVAFQGLPPRERADLGRVIARRHGVMMRVTGQLTSDPMLVAAGQAMDAEATGKLAAWGLLDG